MGLGAGVHVRAADREVHMSHNAMRCRSWVATGETTRGVRQASVNRCCSATASTLFVAECAPLTCYKVKSTSATDGKLHIAPAEI